MEKTDITIIGAGVIGLAIAYTLADDNKDIIVLERHDSFGKETSSRNSEVIHAGLYYPKNSLKSETCIRGKALLYRLCSEHNIPHRKTGKILVAQDNIEIDKLQDIYQNASECGVNNLSFLDKRALRDEEPAIRAEKGLLSPDTGIIDSHSLMKFFHDHAARRNVNFAFNIEAQGIEKRGSSYEVNVKEPGGDSFTFRTGTVINAAGLNSDGIAEMAGLDTEKYSYRIHYCKGQYFRLRAPGKFPVTRPVYPPPTDIDLGIHLTPDLAGGFRLGPDAKYVDEINYDVDGSASELFFRSVSRFLPSLDKSDLIPDTSGIRPKLQAEDEPFRDFVICEESDKGAENFINLIGIESPGLTSCLAIAERVKDLIF